MKDLSDEELIDTLREVFEQALVAMKPKHFRSPSIYTIFNSVCTELLERLGHKDVVLKSINRQDELYGYR